MNAYNAAVMVNTHLKRERDEQNAKYHLTDPSLCPYKPIKMLHEKIAASHDQIVSELQNLIAKGYRGYPMSQMDDVHSSFLHRDTKWSPIWIKFMDSYAGTSKFLPTLTGIVKSLEKHIPLLHISVMWPGAHLPPHEGISMAVWRYHYGLSIPEGDLGMQILDVHGNHVKYRWEEHKGVMWDDTLKHESWNLSSSPRFIIFADVYRNFSRSKYLLSRAAYSLIQKSKHIKTIQKQLEQEGKHID